MCRGYVERLIDICQAPPWVEFWRDWTVVLCTFEDFDLAANATDATVWQVCQDNEVVLITGNRNDEGPDSLKPRSGIAIDRIACRYSRWPTLSESDATVCTQNPSLNAFWISSLISTSIEAPAGFSCHEDDTETVRYVNLDAVEDRQSPWRRA